MYKSLSLYAYLKARRKQRGNSSDGSYGAGFYDAMGEIIDRVEEKKITKLTQNELWNEDDDRTLTAAAKSLNHMRHAVFSSIQKLKGLNKASKFIVIYDELFKYLDDEIEVEEEY